MDPGENIMKIQAEYRRERENPQRIIKRIGKSFLLVFGGAAAKSFSCEKPVQRDLFVKRLIENRY